MVEDKNTKNFPEREEAVETGKPAADQWQPMAVRDFDSLSDSIQQEVDTFTRSLNQQVGAMLTDMEVKVRTMRLLLYQTLSEFDAGKPGSRLSTALLKRYVPRAATEVASDALQIFGGIGYTDVTRVSRIWRDCRGNQIAEGTDEVMVRIATKRVIGQYLADDPSIDL